MTAYYEERSRLIEAAGFDPDDDDVWAQPDYVEALENWREEAFALQDDPWGDEEGDT